MMLTGSLSVIVLQIIINIQSTTAQLDDASPPERFEGKTFMSLFQGINKCAFKEVTVPGNKPIKAWLCGLPNDGKSGKIIYDCCPGFIRSPLGNDQCIEVQRTHEDIISTLQRILINKTAEILKETEPNLENPNSPEDFTVFVPEGDEYNGDKSPDDLQSILAAGRHYSNDFKDGALIPVKKGLPLKISTSPNKLVFVECQPLTQPDLENSNGLIHVIGGPITSDDKSSTVYKNMQSDSNLSAFVADIPNDLRLQLDSTADTKLYTVFAPDNAAWNAAKTQVAGSQAIGELVRQHIVEKLICSGSIDSEPRRIGPSKAKTFMTAVEKPDGSRVLTDACDSEVKITTVDKMAGNGVVHVMGKSLQNPAAMNFRQALNCLAEGRDSDISRAAKEMQRCNIDVGPSENVVVLLPTTEAFDEVRKTNPTLASKLQSTPCPVYQHQVLSSRECNMKNGNGIGVPQECSFQTKYTAPNGDKPELTNQYISERDGGKLYFGQALANVHKPIPFQNGVIYPAASLNTPPTERIIDLIKKDPEMKTTYENMQKAGYTSVLTQNSPNVLFMAPQNHGWITRDKENAYSSAQLRKIFDLHTIPHQMISGQNGNIGPETVQTVDTLSPTKLKIKTHLNRNTYIGHDDLDESLWALTIGEPIIATDGILWPVDWPIACPPGQC